MYKELFRSTSHIVFWTDDQGFPAFSIEAYDSTNHTYVVDKYLDTEWVYALRTFVALSIPYSLSVLDVVNVAEKMTQAVEEYRRNSS